jgi:hypothetical protein
MDDLKYGINPSRSAPFIGSTAGNRQPASTDVIVWLEFFHAPTGVPAGDVGIRRQLGHYLGEGRNCQLSSRTAFSFQA